MNSKRSMWTVLLGVVGVGLLVTNCTLKTDDSCTPGKKKNCSACDDGVTGTQTCLDDGTYDACNCAGAVGGGSNGGGSSAGAPAGGASSAGANNSSAGSSGATTSGGAAGAAGASEGGEGGEGGEASFVDPNNCYDCLNKLCTPEWDACVLEDEDHPQDPQNAPLDYCLNSQGNGKGQIELVLDCIDKERKNGLVKRDAVRACGSSLGQSTDPSFFQWPPPQMTAATAGLMNCMADAPDETNPGTWAAASNIPASGSPKPWSDMTCAKLSCTSAQQN